MRHIARGNVERGSTVDCILDPLIVEDDFKI